MSDVTTMNDPAVDAINEQIAQLDHDIAASTRRLEIDTAVRDRLLELRATLSRKPRARKPRLVGASIEDVAALAKEELATQAPASPWAGFNAPVGDAS